MPPNRLIQRLTGILLGLLVTSAAGLLMIAGAFERLDNFGIDQHFRWFSTIVADPRIVLIDIDDSSISEVGEWPWPRRRHAELVNALHELGAAQIVMDLAFVDPKAPRVEPAWLGPDYDFDPAGIHGDAGTDPPIFDDDELRAAMAAAGNVYLPIFAELHPVNPDSSGADEANEPGPFRREALAYVKTQAEPGFADFLASVAPAVSVEAISPEREAWLAAYRWALARHAILQGSPDVPRDLLAVLPQATGVIPPLEKFASAARACGLAAFDRESSQGVVRDLPMLVNADGKLVAQLGFRAAVDALGLDLGEIALEGDRLVVGAAPDRLSVPFDREGRTLLQWNVPSSGRWQDSFSHLPAAKVLQISDARRSIEENSRRYRIAVGELVKMQFADRPAEFEDYARKINEGLRVRMLLSTSTEEVRRAELLAQLESIDRAVQDVENGALAGLRHAWRLWQNETPLDDSQRTHRARLKELYEQLGEGQLHQRLGDINAGLADRAAALVEELSPLIRDRICLVGYAASAVGDFVVSPVYAAVPGVMAHANTMNMVLQRRIPRRAGADADLALLAVAGALMTMAGNVRGWRFGLASLVLLALLTAAFGAVAFQQRDLHFASLPAVATLATAWAAVTVYRQSTEERARRQLQRALTQYTSAAIAARIMGRARRRDFSPQSATVTCFFSDLTGFTRLSEQLGPERTRRILNPYFEAMSRVLVRRGAIVNKFIGDGVFAFFNAPIRPCPDHAQAACHAALESLLAIRELNVNLAGQPRAQTANQAEAGASAGSGQPLALRIGITTGEVFVGDYGSETKLDYTCIGDTVNTGSRLEEANKAFGTSILVDEPTRRAAGAGFTFRSLGPLTLPGKTAPVSAHELMGLAGG